MNVAEIVRSRDIVRIIAYAGNGNNISKISRFLLERARTLLVDHATGVLSRIRQVAAKFDHKSSVKNIIAQLVKMDKLSFQ